MHQFWKTRLCTKTNAIPEEKSARSLQHETFKLESCFIGRGSCIWTNLNWVTFFLLWLFPSPTKTEKQKQTLVIAAIGCDKAAGSGAGKQESLILLEVMNKQKNSKYVQNVLHKHSISFRDARRSRPFRLSLNKTNLVNSIHIFFWIQACWQHNTSANLLLRVNIVNVSCPLFSTLNQAWNCSFSGWNTHTETQIMKAFCRWQVN